MSGKIILVTGGARSGKSTFAEKIALKENSGAAYIATAQVLDDEMRFRVDLHQKRRPENWETFEAPFVADKAIEQASKKYNTILFDCLTIYLSNIICSMSQTELLDEKLVNDKVLSAVDSLIKAAIKVRADGKKIIFVTNEVGAGIVPENHLARLYRDVSGLANQRIAAVADNVIAVMAGIAVDIKKLAVSPNNL